MFLLFGRMMILSVGRFSNEFKISCVDGFMVCPPSTTAATPRLAKMRLNPAPGETVTTAICPGSTLVNLIRDRKSTRLNSSHLVISYAVFCLKKKNYMNDHHCRG